MRRLQGLSGEGGMYPAEKADKTPLNVSKYFTRQREAMAQKIFTEEGILLRINRSIQAEGGLP